MKNRNTLKYCHNCYLELAFATLNVDIRKAELNIIMLSLIPSFRQNTQGKICSLRVLNIKAH